MVVLNSRSSRKDHCFPAFYACYLLKSIKTSRSTATYIGSTPNPPRRIRQHNGEISQGAWKTKHNRPWAMQMIIYGFPSKLAALQFEWAWQHPHLSRHLRDSSGNPVFDRNQRNRHLKNNVQIVQTMMSSHPYKLWPLHVKLFTEEASKAWNGAQKKSETPLLPPGNTVAAEFEGVDGKSGKAGSGRQGPIDITDAAFIAEYLPKHNSIVQSANNDNSRRLSCSICLTSIANYSSEHLSIALCPTQGCTTLSHLTCLSTYFLAQQPSESAILPRGGECKSCRSYVLWGDIIRGCYRRHKGRTVVESDEDEDELADQALDAGPSTPVKGSLPIIPKTPKRPKAPSKAKKAKKQNVSVKSKSIEHPLAVSVRDDSTEEEYFDLDGIASDESMESGDMEPSFEDEKQPKLLDNLSRLSISSPSRPPSEINPDIIILSD